MTHIDSGNTERDPDILGDGAYIVRETVPYKALLLVRVTGTDAGRKVVYKLKWKQTKKGEPVDIGKIELLTTGQQCAIGGTHHSSNPIRWAVPGTSGKRDVAPVSAIEKKLKDFGTLEQQVIEGVLKGMEQHGYAFQASREGGSGDTVADDRLEPSYLRVSHLLHVIEHMENREDTDRYTYTPVMYAVSASVHGIDKWNPLTAADKDSIADAAATWAAKWPKAGPDAYQDERDKWAADFSRYPAGGFRTCWDRLLNLAVDLGYPDAPHYAASLRFDAECQNGGYDDSDYEEADGLVPQDVAGAVAYFNDRYFVISEYGKTVIYKPAYDYQVNRRYYERLSFDDFSKLYMNRKVRWTGADGKEVEAKAPSVWLTNEYRREYTGRLVFDPAGKSKRRDVLNLWDGFAVEPKPGSWYRLRKHTHDIICGGNDECFDYVMNWMARLVQRPGEQGEVAIVLRSVEGTGKGILARAIKHLLGQHGLHISNARHLVGNFNSHLRDCVFLLEGRCKY